MSKYKLIQLTNSNILNVAANTFLPLGSITRRVNSTTDNFATFEVASSFADTVTVTEPGYYKVTYNGSLSAAAAGIVSVAMLVNNSTVYSVMETAAAENDLVNINLEYILRVCPNCCSSPYNCPVNINFELGDTALSATVASTSNVIVEKVYG